MPENTPDRSLYEQLFAAFRKRVMKEDPKLDEIELKERPLTINPQPEDVSTPKGLCERSDEVLTTEDSTERCEQLGGLAGMLSELDTLNHRKDFLVRTIAEAKRLHDETDSDFTRSNLQLMIGLHKNELNAVRTSMEKIRTHVLTSLRKLHI